MKEKDLSKSPLVPDWVYVDSSPDANFYSAHERLLANCANQPEDKSIEILKGMAGNTGRPISHQLLRKLCGHLSVGKKVFVCVEHEAAFEIKRLNDGANAKLFYEFLNPDEVVKIETGDQSLEKMRDLLNSARELKYEDMSKYDGGFTLKMKADNLISYSFIQRRLACVASFRKNPMGATNKIKACLNDLIEEGFIVEIPSSVLRKKYDTSSKLYQIIEN